MQKEETGTPFSLSGFHIREAILLEDENIIVVNKPSGLLTVPDRFNDSVPCLKNLLADVYKEIFTVHRLDKDTSGILLFAKNPAAHTFYSQAFEKREIEKTYLALVHGKPPQPKGTIDKPIAEHPVHKGSMMIHAKGKPSVTHYELLDFFGGFGLLQLTIETGRTHQIRVHLKDLGNPVVCDPLYGNGQSILLSSFKKKFKLSKNVLEEKPLLSRLGLHAFQLRFALQDGKTVQVEAPLPKDMKALLQQLRKL